MAATFAPPPVGSAGSAGHHRSPPAAPTRATPQAGTQAAARHDVAHRTESSLPEPTPGLAARRAEESAILRRIVDRDERAVEELCHRYSGPLYSLAYQVTR